MKRIDKINNIRNEAIEELEKYDLLTKKGFDINHFLFSYNQSSDTLVSLHSSFIINRENDFINYIDSSKNIPYAPLKLSSKDTYQYAMENMWLKITRSEGNFYIRTRNAIPLRLAGEWPDNSIETINVLTTINNSNLSIYNQYIEKTKFAKLSDEI